MLATTGAKSRAKIHTPPAKNSAVRRMLTLQLAAVRRSTRMKNIDPKASVRTKKKENRNEQAKRFGSLNQPAPAPPRPSTPSPAAIRQAPAHPLELGIR